MRRKVIQLAGKTAVISLPSTWVKKNNVHKHDELDLLETEQGILISLTNKQSHQKIILDITGLNSSLVWHYLMSAYMKGAEEIEIHFSHPELFNPRTQKNVTTIQFIANVVSSLIGMELVRHGAHHCTIKEVSTLKPEEFHTVFKRLFFNIVTLTSDVLTALKEKDRLSLENSLYLEQTINRLFAFCSRALNRTNDLSPQHTAAYHLILTNLEAMADVYTNIIQLYLATSKATLSIFFEKTNELVQQLYTLFYAFTPQQCQTFYDFVYTFKSLLDKSAKQTRHATIIHHFHTFQDYCKNIMSARILLSLSNSA